MYFSIVIPLYNRPDEIEELLATLCEQTLTTFEVIIVEDGSFFLLSVYLLRQYIIAAFRFRDSRRHIHGDGSKHHLFLTHNSCRNF